METEGVMRKFKITSAPKTSEPTPQQIARYRDFRSISHRYERITKRPKKPIYKDPKLFLFLLMLGLIALLLFLE